MAVPGSCPICNAGADHQNVVTSHVYGGAPDQAYFRCAACDVTYLYPQMREEAQDQFYANEFENFMAERSGRRDDYSGPEQHIAAHEQQRQRRLPFVEPHLPEKGGRVLEIGCSSGFMLWPMQEQGLEVFGVEPSSMFLDYLHSRGVEAWADTREAAESEQGRKGFDLIMHFFVMEHVRDPIGFVRQQLDLLRPGGKLIIEIPNADEPLVTLYDVPAFERFYWTVMHIWYFSKKSFGNFLEMFGMPFSIELDQRYGLSNHMVWARDGKPGGEGMFTDVLGAEFEEAYRRNLVKTARCDTLIGIIEKPAE